MSAEALKSVLTAEFEANQVKLIVLNRSKESIDKTQAECDKKLQETLAKADSELAELQRITDRRAMDAAAELANSTANRLATMKARAEKRLDKVAERIFERIVNI